MTREERNHQIQDDIDRVLNHEKRKTIVFF